MPIGLVEILLLTLQGVTTLLLGVLGWVARGYARQVDRNTRFRRHIVGDAAYDSDGLVDEYDDLHSQLREDHDEVRRRLQDLRSTLSRVVRAINQSDEVDVEIERRYDHRDDD